MKTKNTSTKLENLRLKAEELLKKKLPITGSQISEADVLKLMHEIEVHQIELELQQEEIMWAEERSVEEARKIVADEYIELYNLSQSGYFSLSSEGVIIELNLSGAKMLGKERQHLKNSRFGFFITDETRPIFNAFLDKVFTCKEKQSCVINLLSDSILPMVVDLTGIIFNNGLHCLVTATDISGIRQSAVFRNELLSVIEDQKRAEMALHNNEANLRTLIQTIPDLIWVKDTDGVYLSCNTMFERFFGASESTIVGKTDYDFVDKKHADFFRENDRKAMVAGKPTINEEWITFADDGHRAFLETIKTPMFDSSGTLIGVLGIGRDITRRKTAENALSESSVRYKKLTQISPIGIFQTDGNGLTTFVNPAWCEITGLTFGDALGFNWLNAVHPDDKERLFEGWQKAKKLNKTSLSDYRFVRPDRSVAWVMGQAVPETNAEGKAIGYIGTITDITERKIAEKEITMLAHSLKCVNEYVSITDLNDKILFVNESFLKTYGYELDELIGKNINIVRSKKNAPELVNDILPNTIRGEWHGELLNERKDGSEFPIFLSTTIIKDKENRILGLIGVGTDITERKIAEEELINAKERAEESDRLKSAFLANMSHEIRTPMNGIMGFAGLLKEPDLTSEETEEYIEMIEKSGIRMLNIINDIVSISKIESGLMEISVSKTNINEQIEYIYTFFKPETMQKGIQLSVSNPLPADDATIISDKEKIFAILSNLVKNAIKFTSKGAIEFGYEKKGKCLEFFVKDTGIGIPKEQTEFIFERFRQGSESLSRNYEGAGLGLSISKAFVEMLGGKIWVESDYGKGSVFYFTIPCYAKPDEKEKRENLGSVEETKDEVNPEVLKLKILVTDDDETTHVLLKKFVGIFIREILTARNGLEAVETCRCNQDIDFVLMDIKMPEMDGYQATREIRKFNKDVIIIAQTAYAMESDREMAMEAGCNDFISKPFGKAALTALIKKHIQ